MKLLCLSEINVFKWLKVQFCVLFYVIGWRIKKGLIKLRKKNFFSACHLQPSRQCAIAVDPRRIRVFRRCHFIRRQNYRPQVPRQQPIRCSHSLYRRRNNSIRQRSLPGKLYLSFIQNLYFNFLRLIFGWSIVTEISRHEQKRIFIKLDMSFNY